MKLCLIRPSVPLGVHSSRKRDGLCVFVVLRIKPGQLVVATEASEGDAALCICLRAKIGTPLVVDEVFKGEVGWFGGHVP